MPHQRFRVRAVNDWLAGCGAKRGDIIVDRGTPEFRFMLTRFMGEPGDVMRALSSANADGCLEAVDDEFPASRVARGGLKVLD